MTETPVATAEQLEAEQYTALFLQMAQREAHRFGKLIASRPDNKLLGANEFDLRKLLHEMGAAFLEAVLNERKKGATEVRATSVRTASRTPI